MTNSRSSAEQDLGEKATSHRNYRMTAGIICLTSCKASKQCSPPLRRLQIKVFYEVQDRREVVRGGGQNAPSIFGSVRSHGRWKESIGISSNIFVRCAVVVQSKANILLRPTSYKKEERDSWVSNGGREDEQDVTLVYCFNGFIFNR